MKRRNLRRRILALLMALVMTVGILPLAAFAEGEESPSFNVVGGTPVLYNVDGGEQVSFDIGTYVMAVNRPFDGQTADLLTVDTINLPAGVTLQYTCDGVTTATIPQRSAIGEYTVTVTAYMDNAIVATQAFQATVHGNGITVTALNQEYDGVAHPMVMVAGTQPEDIVEYSIDGVWTTECPTMTDVGTKGNISVRVTRNGGLVFAKDGMVAGILINNTLQLVYKQEDLVNYGVQVLHAGDTTLDLGAMFDPGIRNNTDDLIIVYGSSAVITASRDNGTTDRGMTVNAETGEITLQKGDVPTEVGLYEVYAHIREPEGKNNYTEAAKTLTQYIVVYDTPEMTFSEEQLNYILGAVAGEDDQAKVNANVPGLALNGLDDVAPVIPNNSRPEYTVVCAAEGSAYESYVTIDPATGKFTVDPAMLDYIGSPKDGRIESYTVTARMNEYEYDFGTQKSHLTGVSTEIGERKVYGAADASYTLNILQSDLGDGVDAAKDAYKLQKKSNNGWHGGNGVPVTVEAKEGYQLAKIGDESYADELTFTEEGKEHYLFIQNKGKGIVSSMLPLLNSKGKPIKIDSTSPEDFKIVYTKVSVFDIIQEVLSLGFKKSGVTVTISASDAASGVEAIKIWAPEQEKDILVTIGGDSSILSKDSDNPLEIHNVNEDKSSFTARLVITASDISEDLASTGLLKAEVIDLAGNIKRDFDSQVIYANTSNVTESDDITVVTDGDAPQISMWSMEAFNEDDEDLTENVSEDYTEDEVNVTRFHPDVSKISYAFRITDDTLSDSETVVRITDKDDNVVLSNKDVTWTDITDGKQGEFQISGNGEYLITISASDKANNTTVYTHKLVLDTVAPVVDIAVKSDNGQVKMYNGIGYTKEKIVYAITVEDVHFDAERVRIFCEKDGVAFENGKLSKWELVEGNKYQASYTIRNTDQNNGTYTLKVRSSDGISETFPCSTEEKTFANPIVLDTKEPAVTFTYGEGEKETLRTAQLQVSDEHLADRFPVDAFITNGITAKNILDKTVAEAVEIDDSDWAVNHTVTILFNKEANYMVTALPENVLCDLAGNEAVLDSSSKNYETEFTLDTTAPNAPGGEPGSVQVDINISDANKGTESEGNWMERLVDGFKKLVGYWNSPIEVTVTAEDMVSGLTNATYTYTPIIGATKTGTVELTQSEKDRKSFSGTFTLPANLVDTDNQQINGRITVSVSDRSGNEASMDDQSWHITYDTINPKLKVRYETSVNTPENENVIYFDAPATAYVSVLEEHFQKDMLTISNNGNVVDDLIWNLVAGEDGQNWNETSFLIGKADETVVDGEYIITIKGQDYAGNAIQESDTGSEDYTSKTLIVDTTSPVLSNPGVSSGTLKRTGDAVDYYSDLQGVHFTFNVLEKNFVQNTVQVLVQKNGVSAVLGTDYTLTWTEDGDLYTGDVHMIEDGEYSITISGEDPAKNKMIAGENAVITNNQYQYAKKIVLDNTAPELSLAYQDIQTGGIKDGKHYIPCDVQFTLTLKDNFLNAVSDANDYSGVYLQIEKTMNGIVSKEKKVITADMFDLAADQKRGEETLYTYSWTEQDDAEYKIEAFYTDFVYTNVDSEKDRDYTVSSAPEYVVVVDKTAPVLSVVYADGKQQRYYNLDDLKTADNENGYRKAVVTIQERNLDTDVVTDEYLLSDTFLNLTDVMGTSIETEQNVQIMKRKSVQETDHVWDMVFAAEANYKFDLSLKEENGKTVIQDLAGNDLVLAQDSKVIETEFTIDRTAPSAEAPSQEEQNAEAGPGTLNVTFNIPKDKKGEEKWYTNLWEKIRFGFWKETIEVTISCYEEIAGIDPDTAFVYTFTRAEPVKKDGRTLFVSSSNADTFQGKIKFVQDEADKKTYSAVVKLPADVLKTKSEEGILEKNAQLNGTFSIALEDRSKNESKYDGKPESKDTDGEETRLIYDTISPTLGVSFGPVANTSGNKTYFAGNITGTVRVKEANFFIKNGKTDIINTGYDTTWRSQSADEHVGTFKITGEGEHTVTITGKDYASNKMQTWKSEALIIDTQIIPPVITVNGEDANGKAFKDDVMLGISFFDDNFRDVEVQILRTRLDEKNADVTDLLAKTEELDAEGGIISYEPFEKVKDNDGIYVVSVTMTDWANHESTTTAVFSVNRFGSVYTYGNYLLSIIQDGGLYINEVKEDLEIHEFNADRLVGDVKIQITRDGRPVDEILYTSNALQNDIAVGDSGWYEYTHIIKKENFTEDGLYKISVSSQDYAGNYPENTNMEGMSIQFHVDSTPPELTSVTGLEKAIVNAETVDVKYVAYDAVGLKSVKVYLDGNLVEEAIELLDRNNHSNELRLSESNNSQVVRIVLEDLAGNILDTGSKDFESAYVMVQGITISTSFWVRFLANKPLLYGCIITLGVIAAGVGIGVPTVIAIKKKGKYAKRK